MLWMPWCIQWLGELGPESHLEVEKGAEPVQLFPRRLPVLIKNLSLIRTERKLQLELNNTSYKTRE